MSRQKKAEQLAQAVEQLYIGGLLTPSGGNVSCRCGEDFLITPSGKNKGRLSAEDMLLLDADGQVIGGQGKPSIETAMHLAIYQAYFHVGAVIHDHAVSPILVGSFQLALIPYSLEASAFQSVPRLPFQVPGSPQLAQEAADALAGQPGVLLLNHGALTVGATLEEALSRSFMLETAARLVLWGKLLRQVGSTIPPDVIQALKL